MKLILGLIASTFITLPIIGVAQTRPNVGGPASAVAPATPEQGLTNADIIKLQSVGLGESIILSSVNTDPAAYDTSTDGLPNLKKAGVSDLVITAIISRSASTRVGVENAWGTRLTATAQTGPPTGVDEVGVYYQDRNKSWQPIPSEIINTKSGGGLKTYCH
jgi:hypothetical protein